MTDNPTDEQAKAILMAVPPYLLGTQAKYDLIQKGGERGFVAWDASPERNTTWTEHRQTFLSAIHTGLSFCRTDALDEWAIMGVMAFALVRSLDGFVPVAPVDCYPLVYVGQLCLTTRIYVINRKLTMKGMIPSFYVGVHDECCIGCIQNGYPVDPLA